MSNILITSGYNFEGYSITDYLGVYSGECALGTGFLSSLGAGFADFMGTNSGMYSDKLKRAKEHAIRQLLEQVRNAGANAVIGLDIDYTSFSSDIMGVVANGTAVKIVKTDIDSVSEGTRYNIFNTNSGLPFRASVLSIISAKNKYGLALELYHRDLCNVGGIIADIKFTNIFEESVVLNDIMFLHFSEKNNRYLISQITVTEIPENIASAIKSVDVIIKKYILDDVLIVLSKESIELISDMSEDNSECDDTVLLDDLFNALEGLSSSREILYFLKQYNEEHPNVLDDVLLDDVKASANIERLYGNTKNTSISKVKKYFESK